MKNLLLTLLTTYLTAFFATKSTEQFANSTITDVTVYKESARVTRISEEITLTSGFGKVTLTQLSPFIDQSSVQVKLEGNGVINSVKFRKNYLKTEKVLSQIDSIADIYLSKNDSLAVVQLELSRLAIKEDFLESNKYIKGEYTGMNVTDLSQIDNYYNEQRYKVLQERKLLEQNEYELQDICKALKLQMIELQPQSEETPLDLIVHVSKANQPIRLKVEYKVGRAGWYTTYDMRAKSVKDSIFLIQKANVYQNTGENWEDVILSFSNERTDFSKHLPELQPWYLPERKVKTTPIAQTHNPQLSRKVQGYIYDQSTGEPLPFATIQVEGLGLGTDSDFNGYYELYLPPGEHTLKADYVGYESARLHVNNHRLDFYLKEGAVLDEVVISAYKVPLINMDNTSSSSTISSKKIRRLPKKNIAALATSTSGISVSGSRSKLTHYYVDGEKVSVKAQDAIPESKVEYTELNFKYTMEDPYSIISDGKTNEIALRPISLYADFVYRAVPKLSSSVYLTAYIDAWEDKDLTAGNMNLYFEESYIGQSLLDPSKTKDSLTLSLGVDSKISLERKRTKSYTKKIPLSSKKCTEVAYEITVKNNKSYEITLEVFDQIPVTTLKDIEVNNVAFSDKFELQTATGIGHWDINVKPRKNKVLKFNFDVKYPSRYHFQL